MPATARFTDELLQRPEPGGLDVTTTLRHFAIVTYALAPADLARHLHPRFTPDCIESVDGARALLSVVPFLDVDFRLARLARPRFSFGQTNYRAYVVDGETGERCVWFFGTCLGSWTVAVPRSLWRLPWHRGDVRFDCEWSNAERRYARYAMRTESAWASARLELEDSGAPSEHLAGFPDLETGMVVLTHPLAGYFRRRDGELGTYRVWHERLAATRATCLDAHFPLLERLELVPREAQKAPHSVMLQREVGFTIYLPPRLA